MSGVRWQQETSFHFPSNIIYDLVPGKLTHQIKISYYLYYFHLMSSRCLWDRFWAPVFLPLTILRRWFRCNFNLFLVWPCGYSTVFCCFFFCFCVVVFFVFFFFFFFFFLFLFLLFFFFFCFFFCFVLFCFVLLVFCPIYCLNVILSRSCLTLWSPYGESGRGKRELLALLFIGLCRVYCLSCITQTRLFKYTENFTTKNWKFLDKNSDIFFIFLLKP